MCEEKKLQNYLIFKAIKSIPISETSVTKAI